MSKMCNTAYCVAAIQQAVSKSDPNILYSLFINTYLLNRSINFIQAEFLLLTDFKMAVYGSICVLHHEHYCVKINTVKLKCLETRVLFHFTASSWFRMQERVLCERPLTHATTGRHTYWEQQHRISKEPFTQDVFLCSKTARRSVTFAGVSRHTFQSFTVLTWHGLFRNTAQDTVWNIYARLFVCILYKYFVKM